MCPCCGNLDVIAVRTIVGSWDGAVQLLHEYVTLAGGSDDLGESYTITNVGERLAVRNLFDELRRGINITGGPVNFNSKDKQAFVNQLDRWLTATNAPRNDDKQSD